MSIRTIIVDDHSMVREGLKAMLRFDPSVTVVGEAADGQSALRVCREAKPDVVLLDIKMPGCNGCDLVQKIRDISPGTRVIMLTAFDDNEYVRLSLEASADGYLLKNIGRQDLVRAIESVVSGQGFLDPVVGKRVVKAMIGERRIQGILTPREKEILTLMAEGRTNSQIGKTLYLSPNTVKTHVTSIIRKLGASGRTDAVARAVSQGLLGF